MNSTSSLDQAAGAFGGALRSSERARAARARATAWSPGLLRRVTPRARRQRPTRLGLKPHQNCTDSAHSVRTARSRSPQRIGEGRPLRLRVGQRNRPSVKPPTSTAPSRLVDQPVAGDHQWAGVGRAEQQVVDGSDRGRGVCSHGTILADTGPAGLAISLRAASLRHGGRRRVRFPWFGRSSGGGRLPVAPPWERAGSHAHGRAPR